MKNNRRKDFFRKEWILLSNALRRLSKLKTIIPIITRNLKDSGRCSFGRTLETEEKTE